MRPYCTPARAPCSIADLASAKRLRSSRPTSSRKISGKASANSIIMLPARSTATRRQHRDRSPRMAPLLLEDPADGRGLYDGDWNRAHRGAAGDIVVVVVRELDVAADVYRAAAAARAAVVQARNVDLVVGKVDGAGQRGVVERADGEGLRCRRHGAGRCRAVLIEQDAGVERRR